MVFTPKASLSDPARHAEHSFPLGHFLSSSDPSRADAGLMNVDVTENSTWLVYARSLVIDSSWTQNYGENEDHENGDSYICLRWPNDTLWRSKEEDMARWREQQGQGRPIIGWHHYHRIEDHVAFQSVRPERLHMTLFRDTLSHQQHLNRVIQLNASLNKWTAIHNALKFDLDLHLNMWFVRQPFTTQATDLFTKLHCSRVDADMGLPFETTLSVLVKADAQLVPPGPFPFLHITGE